MLSQTLLNSFAPALALFESQSQEGGTAPGPDMVILLVGMFAIVYFVAIRPERKERKRKEGMLEALKKNDKVLTTAGLYATVAAIHEKELTLKFDDGPTRVRAVRSSIAVVLTDGDKGDGAADESK